MIVVKGDGSGDDINEWKERERSLKTGWLSVSHKKFFRESNE